ncbi:MAG: hypothetical protein ABS81_15740 [Pseudonocardia sp. SCN 72-86]|nr:MAG: hypothetical protein ABS81_15740 [Pseudonocardia sp. SCN 72-86]
MVEGDLDLAAIPRFRSRLRDVVRASQSNSTVAVNLSGVPFMGLMAVYALRDAAHDAADRSIDLHVVGCRPVHRRVILLAGAGALLETAGRRFSFASPLVMPEEPARESEPGSDRSPERSGSTREIRFE